MVQAISGCREPEIITVSISACRMRQNAGHGRPVLPAVILIAHIIPPVRLLTAHILIAHTQPILLRILHTATAPIIIRNAIGQPSILKT